jgi:hypothetical protein
LLGAIIATPAAGSDAKVCLQGRHAGRAQFNRLDDFLIGNIIANTNYHGKHLELL